MKKLPAGGRLLVLDETTLRHLPPLRAAWALRGKQAEVRISGKNARRCLFGTVDLRAGRRVLMASRHQRLADFHRFLRKLRHGVGGCGALWLLLDRHGSHQSPSSLRLAEKLGIRLFDLALVLVLSHFVWTYEVRSKRRRSRSNLARPYI